MWLYLPSTSLACAAEPQDSTSGLSLPSAKRLALSVTWRQKLRSPAYWQRVWPKKRWLRRLSGVTCGPSTADRGVASWIASLRDSHANPSAQRVVAMAQRMHDTYGPTFIASLAKRNRASCSLKTSRVSSLFLARTAGRRHNWSSMNWTKLVTNWRRDCSRRLKLERATFEPGSSSWVSATLWPTTSGRDSQGENSSQHMTRGGKSHRDQLPNYAAHIWNWPTPIAADCGDKQTKATKHQGLLLSALSFHPDPKTKPVGGKSSDTTPDTLPRLNPVFVEWLMGWPSGWTDYELQATEWSRWQQQMRSYLFTLV